MAQYMFALMREPAESTRLQRRMEDICEDLTPDLIRGECSSVVAEWPGIVGACYAIQNSEGVELPHEGRLVIGWIADSSSGSASPVGVESDGSYAVVEADRDAVSFFADQFGSRTLWYYFDQRVLMVSTSQLAVVGLKGSYRRNDEALAWFLSSGCQGPFISWDREVRQVRPDHEYQLDVGSWKLTERRKPGMELPRSGTSRMRNYLQTFERQVAGTLSRMIQVSGPGETLLPLSGGLDSRLLFGLCRHVGAEDKIALVNWGLPADHRVFDDKRAAQRVADAYGKPLTDMVLPSAPDNHDQVLERFARESEGRIDHFNAYTDGFEMWAGFFRQGFRQVIRGDLPYTEGLDLDEAQSRAHIGLERFVDFANHGEFPLEGYAALQRPYDIARHPEESHVRWRDRLYVSWRIPLVISAFSDLMSGYTENRAPMMNWSLFKEYMGLPDSAKGNKTHIQKLWQKHDRSGVPFHATGSLRSLADFFAGNGGIGYLRSRLADCQKRGRFDSELVAAVQRGLERDCHGGATSPAFMEGAKSWVADHLPIQVKAYLKSRRARHLKAVTLAYRMVLGDKILRIYETSLKSHEEREE